MVVFKISRVKMSSSRLVRTRHQLQGSSANWCQSFESIDGVGQELVWVLDDQHLAVAILVALDLLGVVT